MSVSKVGGMGDAKGVYGRNRVFREMGGHQSRFIQEGSVLTVNNLRCTSASGIRDVIWLRSCVDSLEFLMPPSMRVRVFPRSIHVRVVIPGVGHVRAITNNRNVKVVESRWMVSGDRGVVCILAGRG